MQTGKPVRVLLIAPSLQILGGQAVQAQHLLSVLTQDSSIRIGFQPIQPTFRPPFGFLTSIKYVRTFSSVLLYTLQLFARVWKYDLIHIFSAGYTSYLFWTIPALVVSKIYRKKIILHYHDGQGEDHLRNWRTAIPTIRMMDQVVSPSHFLVDIFAKFGFTIMTISNLLDMKRFVYRKRSQLRPIFLHNRILEPLYNVQCSLRAFKIVQERYPEASLTLAHDGPSRAELEQFARDLDLRNTVFIGRVPPTEISKLYNQADIYFTSPDFDCMPGSILECFISGLPVVATASGGIPYIATNEETALLVSRDDHQAMAEAALRLLEDPALVERLTKAAYESCTRYAEGPVRDQWVALYHSVMAGTQSRFFSTKADA